MKKSSVASRLAEEDRRTCLDSEKILALLNHAFNQLKTRNEKLILVKLLMRRVNYLDEILKTHREHTPV